MDIENLREIFEEVQKKCIEDSCEELKNKLSNYIDEKGKINLVDALIMFQELSFEQNVKFTWEVMKKIEKSRK